MANLKQLMLQLSHNITFEKDIQKLLRDIIYNGGTPHQILEVTELLSREIEDNKQMEEAKNFANKLIDKAREMGMM
nr:MAG: hypothetical protein [Lokiarchaeota virus Ratatoskr Meg22_1012]